MFLPIIKPKPWVRRDGLSVDFHAGEPPTSPMRPTWASVAAEQGLKEKYKKPATAATLAQGDVEGEAGRRAGWAVLSTNRVFAAGTRTTTLFGGITDQLWVAKVDAQAMQKP